MDLRWAQLSIGGLDYQAELDPEGSMASFSVDLELGEDQVNQIQCLPPTCLCLLLAAFVRLCGCMHSHVNCTTSRE